VVVALLSATSVSYAWLLKKDGTWNACGMELRHVIAVAPTAAPVSQPRFLRQTRA
jgi:hypothetical protein